LREYYTGGTHAGFFDGTTEYDLSKTKLTVFEVGELTEADVHLAGAVIGAVMSAIIRHCQDQYRTGRKVLIVLDEFPLLLKIPVVASAAENLYRTARKFGGVVGVIMQAVIDLTSTEVGRSILRMAPHKIIMRQTQETIVALPEAMNYTPEMCFALSLVHTRKGEYAEAFVDISNANIRERIRYIVSPYMYWLCTTDPKERSMRDNVVLEHQARGLRPDEALDHALRDLSVKFPRGLARVA
jgi:conjugal transfer ATP-binding protein TraC